MKLKSQSLIFLGIVVFILISSGAFLSFFISEKIYSESLQQTIDLNANFIQATAESSLINNDFSSENYEQKQRTFLNFFKNIDTSEIVRIKVWGLDGTIIYSDNKDIVGQTFSDNVNFKSSLTGQIIAEIKEPEKPENVAEIGYGQLMEIYVPITIGNEVSGIIETYVSLDRVNEHVKNTNQIIFTIILITSFIVVVVLLIVYFLIRKNIIVPITILQDHTKQISRGDLNVHVEPEGSEEIQNLARDVSKMSKEIISQREKLIKNEEMKAKTKLMEVKRKKTEQVLYDTIPCPVITFDQNNKFVDCNQHFLDKMGFSKDELMRMYSPDFLTEKDEKTYRDVIAPALNEGKTLTDLDLHIKKRDGSFFHSLWNHISMRDENNEYLGFTAIGLDLTEIDELRDELVKKEKMVALGSFSSLLAHDLRNPLSVIRVSMENLKMLYGTDDTKQSHFDKIERSINRMAHQVDAVLNFVKEQPLTLTKTKTSEIISESLDSLDIPDAIQLILPENDVDITCDKEQLEIALNNLVLNSIQAIVGSGTIEISVEENNDRIVIQVEDSGNGIPKEERDRIFEPLFTTKQHGTGLGLSSVKSIIKAHDGTISVTSSPSIFTITLPKKS